MQTIYRKQNFLQKYFGLILGIPYTIVGAIMFYKEGFSALLPYFYFLFGVITLFFYFRNKNNRGFISWDEGKMIILNDFNFSPVTYYFSEMENFTVSPMYLRFKASNKRPVSVNLKNYEREDVELLRASLA